MDKKTEKLFQKELRIPCHLNHIADRVFKLSRQETRVIISQMLESGLLEESQYAKNYYKIKSHE